jgi:hypothetical protein
LDIRQPEQIIAEPTLIATDMALLVDVFIINSPQEVKPS